MLQHSNCFECTTYDDNYAWDNEFEIEIFLMVMIVIVKVGLSPSKNIIFTSFKEIPLKMMKNAFYFILKVLFVLKIFKFFS